jgi:thioredoxin 1
MSEFVLELTDSDFAAAIGTGVTLVDFWAPWCGPCRMQGPIIDQVAQATQGKAKVAKVNIDTAAATATTHGVQSIPTLIIFKDGQALQQFVGVRSGKDLITAIDKAMEN